MNFTYHALETMAMTTFKKIITTTKLATKKRYDNGSSSNGYMKNISNSNVGRKRNGYGTRRRGRNSNGYMSSTCRIICVDSTKNG